MEQTNDGGIIVHYSTTKHQDIVWHATARLLFSDNGLAMVQDPLRFVDLVILTLRKGPISYFISAVLDTAGITDSITQLNLNLGLNIMQFGLALFGASLVDKVGRRPLLLFANIGCAIVWIGATVSSSINANTGSKSSGSAVVAMIFLFDAIFSVGFTPLQALYPVEVLSFEMRAKGMAFSNFAVSAGMLL